jgi:hypothetical protein
LWLIEKSVIGNRIFLRHSSRICLEGSRKTTKYLWQDGRPPDKEPERPVQERLRSMYVFCAFRDFLKIIRPNFLAVSCCSGGFKITVTKFSSGFLLSWGFQENCNQIF